MQYPENGPEQKLRDLSAEALPQVSPLRAVAKDAAKQVKIGRSLFLDTFDCRSELDYKRRCMKDGRIMYHAHIGMNDMDSTAVALREIFNRLDSQGFRMDRAGFALDRRMGLPNELWASTPAETGPMLQTQQDWSAIAQTAAIQPHLGDFMIGQPASVGNTIQALRIGCTTIGNLSQYFSFQAPGWQDHQATSVETLKAVTLLAQFRHQGCMLHSYLEDGFGALFRYCATVIAWAMLEYYLVEELVGAKLTHCIGGLTSDPLKRSGWVLALQKIHRGDLVGSMIYGDTIRFTQDFDKNRAITAEYMLWDILTQRYSPSGHAVLPLPVTEAVRVPSTDEIIEAQCFGRHIEHTAERLYPFIDFSGAEAFAERNYRVAKTIYDNALVGLAAAGVDIRNPLQLIYVLKQLGAQSFEALFASPVIDGDGDETDMYLLSQRVIRENRELFDRASVRQKLNGKRLLLASTDVHEHAIGALAQLLGDAGAEIVYLGAEQSPDQVLSGLQAADIDAILLSTHNGMALEYARQLKAVMEERNVNYPVIIGGVLNQKVEGQCLPVPVEDELKSLGFIAGNSLPSMARLIAS